MSHETWKVESAKLPPVALLTARKALTLPRCRKKRRRRPAPACRSGSGRRTIVSTPANPVEFLFNRQARKHPCLLRIQDIPNRRGYPQKLSPALCLPPDLLPQGRIPIGRLRIRISASLYPFPHLRPAVACFSSIATARLSTASKLPPDGAPFIRTGSMNSAFRFSVKPLS